MKHYINNEIHKTGDAVTMNGIKYINCTDAWFKKHGAIEVVEIKDEGVSGLYTIDDEGNAVEPYTDQVIKHTETYTDEEGNEQTYEWDESVAHKYFEYVGKPQGRTIEEAKAEKIAEIEAYDTSDAVNGFTLGGQQMWLSLEERKNMRQSLIALKAQEIETFTYWNGLIPITMPVAQFEAIMNAVEVYALQCFNVTAQHKAIVAELGTIAEVDAFDVTVGYPDKLAF